MSKPKSTIIERLFFAAVAFLFGSLFTYNYYIGMGLAILVFVLAD